MALLRIKSAIREKLWSIMGPPAASAPVAPTTEPVGIDRLEKLPLYYDPPECPICTFDEFECHDCRGTIIDPECPFGVGMESITFTHLHIHVVVDTSRTIRVPARRKLCLKCFRIDWAKANPGKPCDL